MVDHLKGKKHQRLAKFQEKVEQDVEKSVYVRGFHPSITMKALHSRFTEFGPVDHVFIHRDKGAFAIVEFKSSDAAEKAIIGNPVVMSGSKLQVKRRERKNVPVKRKEKKHQQPAPVKEKSEKNYQDMYFMLRKCESVTDQMEKLMQLQQLSEFEITQRKHIELELENIFNSIIPGCKVSQFGSSVNGCGVHDCDVDLFLDFHLDREDYESSQFPVNNLPYLKDIKSIEVMDGRICLASLREASSVDRVKMTARILCDAGPQFINIFSVPSTRCPVISFIHRATGLKCDLSLNNRLALQNTQLIQMFMHMDPCVRPLLFTVRHWAMVRGIAGNITTGPRLSNYALSLLVIFFLQNKSNPVLPSVHHLADMADMTDTKSVEGWNCTFVRDSDKINRPGNTLSLEQLLHDFINFYNNTDLTSLVICPRTAELIELPRFMEKIACDPKLSNFKITAMCLQDPFVLDHNTTGNVNEKHKIVILEQLQHAFLMLLRTDFSVPHPEQNWGLPLLFSNLKPEKTVTEVDKVVTECGESIVLDFSFPVVMKSSQLKDDFASGSLSLAELHVAWKRHVCEALKHALQTLFCCEISIAKDAFVDNTDSDCQVSMSDEPQCEAEEPQCDAGEQQCEDIECTSGKRESQETESNDLKCKRQRPNDEDDADPSSRPVQTVSKTNILAPKCLHLKFQCSTKYRLWVGRAKAGRELRLLEPSLDKMSEIEEEVTKKLVQEIADPPDSDVLQFDVYVLEDSTPVQTSLMVSMAPRIAAKEFCCFFTFFRTFFVKLINH